MPAPSLVIPELGPGLALGVGKANYRAAMCDAEGNPGPLGVTPTPKTPKEFFAQTARLLLAAADDGAEWGVLGVPGPVWEAVDDDDLATQRLRVTNIPALKRQKGFDPAAEMARADPAISEVLSSERFTFLTVNDGDLAAQAAAKLYGNGHDVVGDVIIGSGNGGALARRDTRFPGRSLFHPDPGLWEIGQLPLSLEFPSRTMETTIAGVGLEHHLEAAPEELAKGDPIFQEVAHGIGHKVVELGILGGAEVVAISGGIGIKAQHGYRDELLRVLEAFRNSRNPMADRTPQIKIPPKAQVDTYELYGARGAIMSHVARRAIDRLVLDTAQAQ